MLNSQVVLNDIENDDDLDSNWPDKPEAVDIIRMQQLG